MAAGTTAGKKRGLQTVAYRRCVIPAKLWDPLTCEGQPERQALLVNKGNS